MGGNMPQPSGGCKDGNCQVPMGVDVGEYLKQQKEQQKFEQQKMAAQIKAQFASVCECLGSSTATYQTMFVENAKTLNMTDIMDLNQWNAVMPYESKTLKEAKERLFAGMLESICKALGDYMTFASSVEQVLATLTPAPGK